MTIPAFPIRSRRNNKLVHPGVILLDEFMRPYDISQNALARNLGVPPRRINEIVLGKRSITAATALGLEEAFGIRAHFWLALQADYDIETLRVRPAKGRAKYHRPLELLGRSEDMERPPYGSYDACRYDFYTRWGE